MVFKDSQYIKIMVPWIGCRKPIHASTRVCAISPWNLCEKTDSTLVDLPQYSSYEMLRQQLLLAINEGGEGFGFA